MKSTIAQKLDPKRQFAVRKELAIAKYELEYSEHMSSNGPHPNVVAILEEAFDELYADLFAEDDAQQQ